MRRERVAHGANGADPIAQLLAGTWPDPDGGPPIGVPIGAIAIERSLRGKEAELLGSLDLGRHLAVISDPATHVVLGSRVERALAGRAKVASIQLDAQPHADLATVNRIRDACAASDALVAVGSGTVNDLAKYAAALDHKPYAVFATAPSMNGYTSVNAAITVDGHKQTLAAAAARGVFVDLEIFAAAPARLIRAGIGDSICRSTAQCDWQLSHVLRGTAYREAPFALLAHDEPAWLDGARSARPGRSRGDGSAGANAVAVRPRDDALPRQLSRKPGRAPREPLRRHVRARLARPYLHGEQVAVATLAMARLQERMLDSPPPTLQCDHRDRGVARRPGSARDRRVLLARIRRARC